MRIRSIQFPPDETKHQGLTFRLTWAASQETKVIGYHGRNSQRCNKVKITTVSSVAIKDNFFPNEIPSSVPYLYKISTNPRSKKLLLTSFFDKICALPCKVSCSLPSDTVTFCHWAPFIFLQAFLMWAKPRLCSSGSSSTRGYNTCSNCGPSGLD